jgi:unsaturated rhamnogalacturonyl hydrolase
MIANSRQILRQVAAYTMNADETGLVPSSLFRAWQWGQGVALFGLVKAYETLGDEEVLQFIRRWIDEHMAEGPIGKSINTTAPLLAALKLLELTSDSKYEAICGQFADWCLAEAPRADEGAFEHSCTENVYPREIWADTLFMGGIFLAKWGQYTGKAMYTKEAARQFVLHYKYLSDPKTGLIYHGYYGDERARKGVLWGRGNGWYSAAAAEILPLCEGLAEYAVILSDFNNHLEGVKRTQHPSGAWHTVLNQQDTYVETSATAAFAYGINHAIATGQIASDDRVYAQKAIQALVRNIDDSGRVLGGSGGTCVMETAQHYNDIPYSFSYFTQGLALMALSSECDL